MGKIMDRRQKKSREAIFKAFIDLLSSKNYSQITVGEIIKVADVGRATFYSHFETKDFLLKEFLEELFCHIFDSSKNEHSHKHIFECDAPDSVILHLIMHLQKNDNNVLRLLSCKNNELVLGYFKENLKKLFEEYLYLFDDKKSQEVPKDLWLNHVASTFVQTITWWIENGKKEDAETLSNYFFNLI